MNFLLMPLAALSLGAVGWAFVGRRRFERRNFAGVEEFNGYISMVLTRLLERVVRFFSGAALLFGFCGLVMYPGRLLHATNQNGNAAASPAAPPVAPLNARKVVLQSLKCYFYDRNNRLVTVQPASAPGSTIGGSAKPGPRCALPALTPT